MNTGMEEYYKKNEFLSFLTRTFFYIFTLIACLCSFTPTVYVSTHKISFYIFTQITCLCSFTQTV